MSFSKLTFSKTAFQNTLNAVQKRYVHRAPDMNYLSIWKKSSVDFMEKMGRFEKDREYNAGLNMFQSPHLVEQILRVTVAMKKKGFLPFLHAMPASAKVVMKFAEVMHPTHDRHFKYLRPPTLANRTKYEQVVKEIPLREVQAAKPRLLSMSYALTSGIRPLESAASWGFVNHFGKEQYLPMMNELTALLDDCKIKDYPDVYSFFRSRSGALIRKYNRLQVGDFQMIGIPREKIDRFVYDSKPYNVPTLKDVKAIIADPARYSDSLLESGTHMATMLICEETLHPGSGLCIINAGDGEEVKSFCKGIAFTPMKEVAAYAHLVSATATVFEKTQLEMRREADKDLQELVSQFKSALNDPEKMTGLSTESAQDIFDRMYDLPASMP